MSSRLIAAVMVLAVFVVTAHALAADPRLHQIQTVSEGLRTPVASVVSPDGRHLYSLGNDGSVSAFARDARGRLAYERTTNLPARLGDRHASHLDMSRDGGSLALTVNGAIVNFDVAGPRGLLADPQVISDSPETPLDGASDVSFAADGRFVYVSERENGNGAINIFRRDERTGRLRLASVFGGPGSRALAGYPGLIEQAPGARQLYVGMCSNATGRGSIVVLVRDRQTGRLSRRSEVALSPAEDCAWGLGVGRQSVAVSSEELGGVTGFDRDPATGRLTRRNTILAPELEGARFLARPDGGSTFYVAGYENHGLGRLTIDGRGRIELRGASTAPEDLQGVGGLLGLTARGGNVYVSGYNSSSMAVLRRR